MPNFLLSNFHSCMASSLSRTEVANFINKLVARFAVSCQRRNKKRDLLFRKSRFLYRQLFSFCVLPYCFAAANANAAPNKPSRSAS